MVRTQAGRVCERPESQTLFNNPIGRVTNGHDRRLPCLSPRARIARAATADPGASPELGKPGKSQTQWMFSRPITPFVGRLEHGAVGQSSSEGCARGPNA